MPRAHVPELHLSASLFFFFMCSSIFKMKTYFRRAGFLTGSGPSRLLGRTRALRPRLPAETASAKTDGSPRSLLRDGDQTQWSNIQRGARFPAALLPPPPPQRYQIQGASRNRRAGGGGRWIEVDCFSEDADIAFRPRCSRWGLNRVAPVFVTIE